MNKINTMKLIFPVNPVSKKRIYWTILNAHILLYMCFLRLYVF